MSPITPRLLPLLGPALTLASIIVGDPSDVISPSDWVADNAIYADYNIPFPSSQPGPIEGVYVYEANTSSIDHSSFSATENDTSVIVVSGGGHFNASYVDIIKTGYSTNLLTASFWGFNAAVNIANASTANLSNVNITVHNGAANVYAYNTGTVVNVDNAWLYSSGPVSHGLYATGHAIIVGRNIQHFSGGMRSSSFAGDSPAGYVSVYDSFAHTLGIGSATFYALGSVYGQNVVSLSENAPVVFMDGPQNATLVNCQSTAGLLGGLVIFSSQTRTSGSLIKLINSKITTLGSVPGLWFGNVIAKVLIKNTEIITPSSVLIVANYSQITQDFNVYGGYPDNPGMSPAEVYADVQESKLTGDLVAYNGSLISFKLDSHSTWNGAAYTAAGFGSVNIGLSADSSWTLTNTSTIQNLTSADATLSNINGGGYQLYYNASLSTSLGGKVISLTGGGEARPIES